MLLFIKHNHYHHHHHRVLEFFVVITMLFEKYRYWYWVLVSLEANIIGYWILGAFFGIVLTLLFNTYYIVIYTRKEHNDSL